MKTLCCIRMHARMCWNPAEADVICQIKTNDIEKCILKTLLLPYKGFTTPSIHDTKYLDITIGRESLIIYICHTKQHGFVWPKWKSIYGSGHGTVAVLLPGFAISWQQNQVTRQSQFRDLAHILCMITQFCPAYSYHDRTCLHHTKLL